jgi:hypothetical protein
MIHTTDKAAISASMNSGHAAGPNPRALNVRLASRIIEGSKSPPARHETGMIRRDARAAKELRTELLSAVGVSCA